MQTTQDQESIKEAGEITDKARGVTQNENKLGNLFFSLLEKPKEYIHLIKKIVQNAKDNT